MPFSEDFSVTQQSEDTITLADSSTGSDPNLTGRRIYLYKFDNTTLVPVGTTTAYIEWSIASSSIELVGILDKDYALNIYVEAISSSPIPGSSYTKQRTYLFDQYTLNFLVGLTAEDQARFPSILNDTNYLNYKSNLDTFLSSAQKAVARYSDIYAAQFSLSLAYNLMVNQNIYF